MLDLHLGMNRVRVVQNVLESDIGVTESVREVLGEDPSHVGVGGLLDSMALAGTKEGVVGQAVQERRLLDDLMDRVLNGRSLRVWDTSQVHRYKQPLGVQRQIVILEQNKNREDERDEDGTHR